MLFWMVTMLATAMPIAELDWRVVNDTVMGGVSQSRVGVDETVTFDGVLSLEQNGGFASMRARAPSGVFEDGEALRVVVIGDGRTYDLTLRRSDVPLRAGSYRVRIPTDVGETELLIPLEDFRPTSFGRPVHGAPALDSGLDRVTDIGVMLADKQPGAFALEVLEISVIKTNAQPMRNREQALDGFKLAIRDGVPLFNRGDLLGCRDVYRRALTAALQHPGLTPGERSILRAAVAAAADQTSQEGAWTLRHAMDSVLRSGT